jgi:hypothetical protein
MGYRAYVPLKSSGHRASAAEPGDNRGKREILENAFFRVQVDVPRGVIVSILDKRAGRDLVDRGSQYGFGQYVYERFDRDDHERFLREYCKVKASWIDEFGRAALPPAEQARHETASPQTFRLLGILGDAAHAGPLVLAMESESGPSSTRRVGLSIALSSHQPVVELKWQVDKKDRDPWPEAGWLCLPFAIDQPQFRLGRPGSIIDPSRDCVHAANNEVFCIDTGLTITGSNGKGVGICPLDTPLVSLGQPGGFRFTRDWSPRKPTVFVNLFNNIWGTNFQQWIGGSWTSRVRIWSVAGKGAEADLITPAWEARNPCQAGFFDGPAGKLPPVQAGLELSRKGVLVTAFGPNPDGEGILLRLWEQAGQDGPCKVTLPEGLRGHKARLCGLRGRTIEGTITSRDGQLEVPLTHFAPTSVLLVE